MMDEEYWDAEYWEHVRRCDENGKAIYESSKYRVIDSLTYVDGDGRLRLNDSALALLFAIEPDCTWPEAGGGGQMIPDEVREEIKRALDLALENCLGPYRQFMADDEDYLNELEDDPDIQSIRNAQRWLDKPYSHRNGESEPPKVKGFYFVVARYGVNVVRLAKGTLTQCGDANRYQVPIHAEVAYYGPIPEPQQEDNVQ